MNIQVEFLKQQYSMNGPVFGNYHFPDVNGIHIYNNPNSNTGSGSQSQSSDTRYGSVSNTQSN